MVPCDNLCAVKGEERPQTPPLNSTQRGGERSDRGDNIFFSRHLILEDLRLIQLRLQDHSTLLCGWDTSYLLGMVVSMIDSYERITPHGIPREAFIWPQARGEA